MQSLPPLHILSEGDDLIVFHAKSVVLLMFDFLPLHFTSLFFFLAGAQPWYLASFKFIFIFFVGVYGR